MQRILITGAALVMVVVAEAVQGAPITCGIDWKVTCGPAGCYALSPGSNHYLIDMELQTFSSCHDKGCDEYPAIFTQSGAFTLITFAPGAFAKLSDSRDNPAIPGWPLFERLHLMEVVSSGLGVTVSFGTCSTTKP